MHFQTMSSCFTPHLGQEVFPQQVDNHHVGRKWLVRITAELCGSNPEVQLHFLHAVEDKQHILGLVSLPAQ